MGRREVHTGFWWRNLREGDHLENPSVDGRIILKWILESGGESMDWKSLAQEMDRLWVPVNVAMNLCIP